MKSGSLFTGYGGLDLAVEAVLGARTVWTSDNDPGASKIIAARFPNAPNLGDLTVTNWADVEPIDILTGGFPCQDLSLAGARAGLRPGTRSGLWEHMAYAIEQLRPRYVVAENVRGLLSAAAHSDVEPCPVCVGDRPDGHMRALGAVLGDLADLGYDARWCGLRAADVGAPHGRFRIFLVATDTRGEARDERPGLCPDDPARVGWRRPRNSSGETALLPTPNATRGRKTSRTGPLLAGAVELLPTPSSVDGLGGHERRGGARGDELLLAGLVKDTDRFGQYADAIARWTPIIGRPAPDPTTRGRLNPRFVEWMQGCPDGWVCDIPGLTRAQQLHALGNGVVQQQAVAALLHMIGAEP